MFKATHKGRATTLSKALFTAGLLGGAALSTLSAGSAQAAGGWAANPVGPTQRAIHAHLVPRLELMIVQLISQHPQQSRFLVLAQVSPAIPAAFYILVTKSSPSWIGVSLTEHRQ